MTSKKWPKLRKRSEKDQNWIKQVGLYGGMKIVSLANKVNSFFHGKNY